MKYVFLTSLSLAAVSAYAADKRPNIILILADDMGYSDIGCYGGEISTPNIDRLAKEGLSYRQFYNGARSCPTRASLMTGLYAHQAGMGWMTAADLGRPEYQGYLNRECVTIAEVLQTAGYATYMSGKWHLASERQNLGKMKEYWPNQRGFEQYFGIVEGASNYFTTTLNRNNDQYKQEKSDDFYLTTALSDTASMFIENHDFSEKPMFLYLAYNAPHWPLHALPKDIAKYKDTYKRGWDVLRRERFERQKRLGLFGKDVVMSERDSLVPAWSSLSSDKQAEFASRMAIYAAQVDAMDQGIGKVLKALKDRGQWENTVVVFLSDNGACAEFISSGKSKTLDGSAETYESYRRNWANLSSTPYKEYKHHTNEGGIATPMIVHYPNGIEHQLNGGYAPEYGHIIDIMPTFAELAHADYPAEYRGHRIKPMEGVSLVPNFSGKKTGRGEVFWEHEANIAVRDGKWKIVSKTLEGEPYDESKIKLYDMEADPTELHDLAATMPELRNRLYADWNRWAERVGVLPLDTRGYGQRRDDYRRNSVNGSFDENFGHWDCHTEEPAEAVFSIDEKEGIHGRTAHISIAKQGVRPANVSLKWDFGGHKGETVYVSFNVRSALPTSMKCRVENRNRIKIKPVDANVDLSGKGVQSFSFASQPLDSDAPYQLAFYLGLTEGDVWIDDVTITYK